jgi:hypothetical protein
VANTHTLNLPAEKQLSSTLIHYVSPSGMKQRLQRLRSWNPFEPFFRLGQGTTAEWRRGDVGQKAHVVGAKW